MASIDDFNLLFENWWPEPIIDVASMNDVWESNDPASPLQRTASIDAATLFIDPLQINTASELFPLSPLSSSGSVDSQELEAIADWDIFPELAMATHIPEDEFGLSSSPISSSSSSQPETRRISPTPSTNYDINSLRRGPGRPKNCDREKYAAEARIPGVIGVRRKLHNDSSMRSRLKIATGLEQLWDEVPERLRIQALGRNPSRYLARADKLKVVLSCMRIMQAKVKSMRAEI